MESPGQRQGVIPLEALTRADRGGVGAKAATLGELARAGFPVPEGLVVTGEPGDAVVAAQRMLGDAPLAVRSSAIAEDLADASFAGQYDTVLDVRGADALYETFPPDEARRIAKQLEFHYTPKHGSWLNQAEIELSVLTGQCLDRPMGDRPTLEREVASWEVERNDARATVEWRFTSAAARTILHRIYPAVP